MNFCYFLNSKTLCLDPFGVFWFLSANDDAARKNKKGNKIRPPLPWSVRYKVAVGTAEAIMYLHNGTEQCVVHRDIKPSNILLSSNKTPKVKKSHSFNSPPSNLSILNPILWTWFTVVWLWISIMDFSTVGSSPVQDCQRNIWVCLKDENIVLFGH